MESTKEAKKKVAVMEEKVVDIEKELGEAKVWDFEAEGEFWE